MFLCCVLGVRLPLSKGRGGASGIDRNRRVAEVARELDLHENLLRKWVADERRRMPRLAGVAGRILVGLRRFRPMSGRSWSPPKSKTSHNSTDCSTGCAGLELISVQPQTEPRQTTDENQTDGTAFPATSRAQSVRARRRQSKVLRPQRRPPTPARSAPHLWHLHPDSSEADAGLIPLYPLRQGPPR